MTQMAAQVPALFEALSGMNMGELFSKVKRIADKSASADGEAAQSTSAGKK
jgi:flotillin